MVSVAELDLSHTNITVKTTFNLMCMNRNERRDVSKNKIIPTLCATVHLNVAVALGG